jgi:hypothetical protein
MMAAWMVAGLVGAASGLHAATWGMYKDSLHEGFSWRTYSRSVLVGIAAGLLVQWTMGFDLRGAPGLVVLFGLAYVAERGAVEFYKSFIRREDQAKYFIPMQFAVGGRVIHNALLRGAAGIAYAGGVLLVVLGVAAWQRAGTGAPPALTALLLGSIGGWISALGGAWKDAPKEGFQPFKFCRSPSICALYGLLLGTLTSNYVAIAFGALGFTVATIETWNSFVKAREPRGKFAGKPVLFPEALAFRRPFAGLYAALWVAILMTFALALMSGHNGLIVIAKGGLVR